MIVQTASLGIFSILTRDSTFLIFDFVGMRLQVKILPQKKIITR